MEAALTVVIRVLDLVIAGSMTLERAHQLKGRIEAMVAEGREPSDEDWADLFAGIDADSAFLDQAAKA